MPDLSQPLQDYLKRKPAWLREVASLPVHSTHEHMLTETQRIERGADTYWWLCQYNPTDLYGAGVADEKIQPLIARTPGTRLEEVDESIFETLPLTRHSGYGESLRRAINLFGGTADLTRENLAACIPGMEERLTPGYYQREFERCGLLSVQTNSFDMIGKERLPVRREACAPFHYKDLFIDKFLHWPLLQAAQQEKSLWVKTFDEWEELVIKYFEDDAKECIAVKCALAYERRLNFEKTERADAVRALSALQKVGKKSQDRNDLRTFQNYGLRFILELAAKHQLPVKFHTGHYAGHREEPLHRIRDNLIDIEPLIRQFPKTNFVVMHHAYPYGEAAVTLAKSYANCFIDQCWTWAMNPGAASRYLYEFLLGAPANKIFLFGGDYFLLEMTLGHLDLARHGLCITLERLVQEGWAAPDEALTLARRVCYQNQEALFPQLKGLHQK